nr:type II toxin-antitoxin system RelE/ParE family toxin [uncultured Achromobacter sp.]
MPVLEWRQTAREDLLAIVEYLSDDSPAAALRLLDEIEQKVAKLRRRPRLYRVGRVAGTREMVGKPPKTSSH